MPVTPKKVKPYSIFSSSSEGISFSIFFAKPSTRKALDDISKQRFLISSLSLLVKGLMPFSVKILSHKGSISSTAPFV